MPLLSSFSSISAKALGLTSSQFSGVGDGCWINRTSSATKNVDGTSTESDSSGNVYVVGNTGNTGGGQLDIFIAKYNSSGVIQWQRILGNASYSDGSYNIAIDSSSNVYVVGYTQPTGSLVQALVAKYNSSGTIQWQKNLVYNYAPGAGLVYGQSVAIDSSGNLLITGLAYVGGGGAIDVPVIKMDSSGAVTWQRQLGTSGLTTSQVGSAIAVDTAGRSTVCGYDQGTTPFSGIVAQYNSSGTLQWQRKLTYPTYNFLAQHITTDSSDNIYVLGRTETPAYKLFLIKYNSSGAIQWQRELNYTTNLLATGVTTDSSGNVYLSLTINALGYGMIIKYNSSGTIQWQRAFTTEYGYTTLIGNVVGTNYHSTGTYNDGTYQNTLTIKLPTDGSKIGYYQLGTLDMSYTQFNLNDVLGTLTDSAGTLTDAAGTLTLATTTLTDSAGALTSATLT
jgi:hypothetical protein